MAAEFQHISQPSENQNLRLAVHHPNHIVDRFGSVVSQLDGVGITTIQKQFGFKSTKQTWAWLESIGYGKDSGHWKQEMAAHETAKLDRSALAILKARFAQHKGDRQQLLGE